ncbi:MAG: YqgE/AlgH family protein [Holosporaceae bacterium]|jgi:putative transcriptional regulator|nr:YqgE/AlgH family protein [Holosporaceae bacterium]
MSNTENDIQNLTGKILIATPSISNDYLSKSMVYVCSHNKNGAMGVVINKIIPNMSIKDILKRLHISTAGIDNIDTYFGGSQEIDRCFIIHSDDYLAPESSVIGGHIALTINSDIIKAMTSSGGPMKKILCMGCCLWETEQLENEVACSYWIPIEADEALIFGNKSVDKWSKALLKIGSKTSLFSDVSGNA